jgi:TRAP-type mannitol/chloroaromatic compound transport system permease small subunit
MLEKIANTADVINDFVGRSLSWFTLLMVLLTVTIVILRYGFNLGWIALQESVLYMHACVFMLGSAYTLQHKGHVRVDIFYQKCSLKTQIWVDLFGTLFLLYPTVIFIFWISLPYVESSWALFESSREPGGLPGVFLIKTLIPLMALLLFIQATGQLARSLTILFPAQKN